jgi:hypothetical protein
MTILASDVKLLESQRLTDNDDGGGRATGTQVVSGDVNNLFEDISRIDRTTGDVSLRKVFVGVHTDNTDRYLGAHVILTDVPDDEHVSVLLFNTESQTDERLSAQDRIESYVVKGTSAPFYPLGNQLVGQRSLLLFQRIEERIPEVGEVFVIMNETTDDEQYIRVTKVTHEEKTFYVDFHGALMELLRREIVIEITAALEKTYPGGEPYAVGITGIGGVTPARFLSTQVADSARYFGMKRLSANALSGALEVKVSTVYENIVPSATSETPLADQDSTLGRFTIVQTGENNIELLYPNVIGNALIKKTTLYLGGSITPLSLHIEIVNAVFDDRGDGTLIIVSDPGNYFISASVDYETGYIELLATVNIYPSFSVVRYKPGAPKIGRVYSSFIPISIQNRQYNYTLNLADAPPFPGSLMVEYMALGKWVQLRDTGAGALTGQGSGSINYATGSVIFTTAALPDADSTIIYSFLSQEFIRYNLLTEAPPLKKEVSGILAITPGQQILKGSVSVSWTSNAGAKSATDAGGQFTGHATGRINYVTGEYELYMTDFPLVGTEMDVVYEEATALTGTFTYTPPPPPPEGKPEVIETTVPTGNAGNISINMPDGETIVDDGNGNLTGNEGSNGTVDYGTGAVKVARNNKTIQISSYLNKSTAFYAQTWYGGALQEEYFTGNGSGTWTGDLGHTGTFAGGEGPMSSGGDWKTIKVKIPYVDGSANQVFLTVTIESSYRSVIAKPSSAVYGSFSDTYGAVTGG